MTDNPKHVHMMDQGLAALRDLAKASWTYYDALRKEGFTDEQALLLAMEWVRGTRPTE